MIDYQQALQAVLDAAQCTQSSEYVVLKHAQDRICAAAQASPIAVPGFANSAMDGYAVQSTGLESGKSYPISQRIAAGDVAQSLTPNTVARIFTGAMMPSNADAVVIQEDSRIAEDGVSIVFDTVPQQGDNVRPAGDDLQLNQMLLQRGERIKSAHLGLLASAGIERVFCYRPLRIAFFSTGDELVDPGAPLKPGQIYNSNRVALQAEMKRLGADVIDMGICPDSAAATAEFLQSACAQADCVISTGGMSVGEEDHVATQLSTLGEVEFWKVAIKPGKPLAFGRLLGAHFFGLPGNPVSAFVTFQLFVRPWLLKVSGANQWHLPSINAQAKFEFHNKGNRKNFLRGQYRLNDQGIAEVDVFPKQGSGVFSSIAYANALVQVDAGQQIRRGDRCMLLAL